MNTLPIITNITTKINTFIKTIIKHKKKNKLFQFLNNLNKIYNTQKNQLLLLNPLPNIKTTYSIIQQKKSQKNILTYNKTKIISSTLFNKNNKKYPKYNNLKHPKNKY